MDQYLKISVRAANGIIPLENVQVNIEKNGKRPEKRDLLTDINGNTQVSAFRYDEGDEYIVKAVCPGFRTVSLFGIKGEPDDLLCVSAEPEPADLSELGEEVQIWSADNNRGTSYKKLPETKEDMTDLLNVVSLVFPSVPFYRKESSVTVDEIKTAVKCFQKISGLRENGETDKKTLEELVRYSDMVVRLRNGLYLIRRFCAQKRRRINTRQLYNAVSAAADLYPGFRKKTEGVSVSEKYTVFSEYFKRKENDKYYQDVFRRIAVSLERSLPEFLFSGCGYRFRGTVYRPGDENADIIMLQTYLKYISYEIEGIGKVTVNGVYDEATAGAVRTFQKKYGLYPDGRTDMFTWNGIADLYNFFHKPLAFYKIR